MPAYDIFSMSSYENKHHDQDIAGRILIDREGAFRDLVTEHQAMVLRLSYQFTGSEEDAEDLTQEVFILVYKNLHDFRYGSSMKTWIYRITLNQGLNFVKKKKRESRYLRISTYKNLFIPAADSYKADKPLCAKETRFLLRDAINSLPENQRLAFILNKVEDLTAREVAAILDTSLSATEALLHRARKTLRKKLQTTYKSSDHE